MNTKQKHAGKVAQKDWCWVQDFPTKAKPVASMAYCTRRVGHSGPHNWKSKPPERPLQEAADQLHSRFHEEKWFINVGMTRLGLVLYVTTLVKKVAVLRRQGEWRGWPLEVIKTDNWHRTP